MLNFIWNVPICICFPYQPASTFVLGCCEERSRPGRAEIIYLVLDHDIFRNHFAWNTGRLGMVLSMCIRFFVDPPSIVLYVWETGRICGPWA